MTTLSTPPQRILLVDDDPQFLHLMKLRLRSFLQGAEFTTVSSIEEARQVLASLDADKTPDLVVLDYHLAGETSSQLLQEGLLEGSAVLSVSSDDDPEIPGEVVGSGANFFLSKSSISEPLVRPLVLGLIERNRLQRELQTLRTKTTAMEAVKTLVGTLRHEINNPLGAVLGAAYILKTQATDNPQLAEAARLVDESGNRIKHVIQQLSSAMALESVNKSNQVVFHIPGDKPWNQGGGEG
jgi:signal transduction histidine kinase